MTYPSEFCKANGLVLLEERERSVVVGAWKPVRPAVRRCLAILHGKSVDVHRIDADAPEVQLALYPIPVAEAETDHLADRTHNLPPVEEYLRRIVSDAVERGATDLSVWKRHRRQWVVSVRIGGQIKSAGSLDTIVAERLIRHLITQADLDLIDRFSPQDGVLTFPWLPDQPVRIAVVGDRAGRYVALRFLHRTSPELSRLGFTPRQRHVLTSAARQPHGLILFAGPTGGGKTTSMAALLSDIAQTNRKIVSLEDPVEYRLPGIVQIERTGGTIRGDLIAAALRQDPDVLAFGEIRREAHARQLEEAVLSGHLVVSSVHAGSVAGTLERLQALGMSRVVVKPHCLALCIQHLEGEPLRLHASVKEAPWTTTR